MDQELFIKKISLEINKNYLSYCIKVMDNYNAWEIKNWLGLELDFENFFHIPKLASPLNYMEILDNFEDIQFQDYFGDIQF